MPARNAFQRHVALLAGGTKDDAPPARLRAEVPSLIHAFAARSAGGGGIPGVIRLQQAGEMRLAPGRAWQRFTARQFIAVRRPGFVWFARIHPVPLIWVDVLDAYVAGEGFLEARLFGCLRLAQSAGVEASRGQLMRYLAELPWAPQALLQNPELHYRETGPGVVEVAANSPSGPAQVRLLFENGDLVRVEAGNRPRMLGSRLVPTPWAGLFYDYRDWNGWRIPMRAEVGWIIEAGMFVYWRGEITEYRSECPAPVVRCPLQRT